jgi:hypothetical protein
MSANADEGIVAFVEVLCCSLVCVPLVGCWYALAWVAYATMQSWCSKPQRKCPDFENNYDFYVEEVDWSDFFSALCMGSGFRKGVKDILFRKCSLLGFICCPCCISFLYCARGLGCCCCSRVCTGFWYPCCCCPNESVVGDRPEHWFAPVECSLMDTWIYGS